MGRLATGLLIALLAFPVLAQDPNDMTGQEPKNTYKDLIWRPNANLGLDAELRRIFTGNGVGSPLWLSTTDAALGTDAAQLKFGVAFDLGLTRSAAGVLKVTNGSTGYGSAIAGAIVTDQISQIGGAENWNVTHVGLRSQMWEVQDYEAFHTEMSLMFAVLNGLGERNAVTGSFMGWFGKDGTDFTGSSNAEVAASIGAAMEAANQAWNIDGTVSVNGAVITWTPSRSTEATAPAVWKWLLVDMDSYTVPDGILVRDESEGDVPYGITSIRGPLAISVPGVDSLNAKDGVTIESYATNSPTFAILDGGQIALYSDSTQQRIASLAYDGGVVGKYAKFDGINVGDDYVLADGKVRLDSTLNDDAGNEAALTLDYTVNKAAGDDAAISLVRTDTASNGTTKYLSMKDTDDAKELFFGDFAGSFDLRYAPYGSDNGNYTRIGFHYTDMLMLESANGVMVTTNGGFYDASRSVAGIGPTPGGVTIGSTSALKFANNAGQDATRYGPFDIGLARSAAGVVGVTNGSTGWGSATLSNLSLTALLKPDTPTIDNVGTPGSTSYSYKVVAKLADGSTTNVSSAGGTATGNAVLDGTNYNRITWYPVPGVTSYDVYRSTSGGTPPSVGKILTSVLSPQNDTGLAASGAEPTENTTGNLSIYDGGGNRHVLISPDIAEIKANDNYYTTINPNIGIGNASTAKIVNYTSSTNNAQQGALYLGTTSRSGGSQQLYNLMLRGFESGGQDNSIERFDAISAYQYTPSGGSWNPAATETTFANITPLLYPGAVIGTNYGIKLGKPMANSAATIGTHYGFYMNDHGTAGPNVTYTNPSWGLYVEGQRNYIEGLTSVLDNATGDETALTLNYTVNKATSGSGTGIVVSETDTLSPAASREYMKFKTGGLTMFEIYSEAGGGSNVGWSMFGTGGREAYNYYNAESIYSGGANIIKATQAGYAYEHRHRFTASGLIGMRWYSDTAWTGNDAGYGHFYFDAYPQATSGTQNTFVIKPTYTQSGTAGATDLLIRRTETSIGSGAQNLIDAQVGTASKFAVRNDGRITLSNGAYLTGAACGGGWIEGIAPTGVWLTQAVAPWHFLQSTCVSGRAGSWGEGLLTLGTYTGGEDVGIARDGAGLLRISNASTGYGGIVLDANVRIWADTLTLSDNTLTDLVDLTLASGEIVGGEISYTADAQSGGDYQVHGGILTFSAFNDSGAITCDVKHVLQAETTIASSGTLVDSFACADTTGKVTLRATFDSTLDVSTTFAYKLTIHRPRTIGKK